MGSTARVTAGHRPTVVGRRGSLFDEVVVVDWSASSVPKLGKDSIWVAHWEGGRSAPRPSTANLATRSQAFDHVAGLLERAVSVGRTVLVAVDFSLGYPAGFADCTKGLLGPGHAAEPPWWRTWSLLSELIEDGPDNANERFAVAAAINRRTGLRLFWGRPGSAGYERLEALPPTDRVPSGLVGNPCAPLRTTERLAGRGIRSNFQLFGGVTVGGQVLMGIPWLRRLLAQFRRVAVVWPFETGFTPDPLGDDTATGRRGAARPAAPPQFVFAELWPSVFSPAAVPGRRVWGGAARSGRGAGTPSPVRDESQVIAAATACAERDAPGWAAWFDPASVASLPETERAAVLAEEGWILGI